MKNDEFGEFIKTTLEDHRVDVPKDEIWTAIEAKRRTRASRPDRTRFRWAWTLRAAALLLLGVAIGRFTFGSDSEIPVDPGPRMADALRAETAGHFAQVELVLSLFGAEGEDHLTAETVAWARGLLADTQLLIDSPVGEDPEMKRLLEELELILAQIGSLALEDLEIERDLIQESMNERDMLERLRTATDPGLNRGAI